MGYLSDLKDIEPGLKMVLILLIMMPFWYAYFGAFYPDILLKSDLILEICYCIVLSLIGGFFYIFPVITLRKNAKLDEHNDIEITFYCIVLQLILMFFYFIFTNILDLSGIHPPFGSMVGYYFLPAIFYYIIKLVKTWARRKK